MKLNYPTRQQAQDKADQIYAALNPTGIFPPGTTGWDVARPEPDGTWSIFVDDRCRSVLTDAEALTAGFPTPDAAP